MSLQFALGWSLASNVHVSLLQFPSLIASPVAEAAPAKLFVALLACFSQYELQKERRCRKEGQESRAHGR